MREPHYKQLLALDHEYLPDSFASLQISMVRLSYLQSTPVHDYISRMFQQPELGTPKLNKLQPTQIYQPQNLDKKLYELLESYFVSSNPLL